MSPGTVSSTWWYYVGLGILAGGTAIALLAAPGIWAALVLLAAIAIHVPLDRARSRAEREVRGRARPARTAAIWLLALVLIGATLYFGWVLVGQGSSWASWVAGLVVFGVVTVAGLIGDHQR
ncbi:MAG: hypothetical protein ACQEW8_07815 [Actinomycetota bacterium]